MTNVFPLACLALLSFIILVYKWIYTKSSNQIPSPRKLPIIGNLHQLGALRHRSLQTLSQIHGDLMLLHLGSKPTLVVSSAKYAEEIMKTYDIVFANRPNNRVAPIILYNNKDIGFANYGEYWRRMKNISVTHMLSDQKVRSFRKVREEEVVLMVERIRKSAPSVPVNLSENFTSFTNDVVSSVAFGRKYAGEEGCENIKELLSDFVKVMVTFCIGDVIPWLRWIDHLSGVLRKATQVAKDFEMFFEKIIQEHIDRDRDRVNLPSDNDDRSDNVKDVVDALLEIQRNDPSLEKDAIKALLVDIISAGIETTTTVLEWAMSELLTHPRAMKKLQEEVRRFANDKTIIDEDELKNMRYLKAVIKEALRLHHPLPLLLFREASQDVKIHNYQISAGTQVIINAWAIQRHPASWNEPEKFRPERFLNTSVDMKGHNFEFIPFGAGKRSCPGVTFANVKVELVLANLVGLFDWELPSETEGDSFMAETFGASVHRQNPLMAIPTPYPRN